NFLGVGVRQASVFRRRWDHRVHILPTNANPHHILEGWLAPITDRIMCKTDKIDLVIIILSGLREHGHQESRRTIDIFYSLSILVYSES
ncbi:hypothetical protein P692DRAFT_20760390, partial [Suillus brevipes Sb2]